MGGRLVLDAPEDGARAAPAAPPGVQLRLGTSVLGFYDDELGRLLLAVQHDAEGARVLLVQARAMLFAVGGHASTLPVREQRHPGRLQRPGGGRPPPAPAAPGRGRAGGARRRAAAAPAGPAVRSARARRRRSSSTPARAPPRQARCRARRSGPTGAPGSTASPIREAGGRERRVELRRGGGRAPALPCLRAAAPGGGEDLLPARARDLRPGGRPDGRTTAAGIWAAGDLVRPGRPPRPPSRDAALPGGSSPDDPRARVPGSRSLARLAGAESPHLRGRLAAHPEEGRARALRHLRRGARRGALLRVDRRAEEELRRARLLAEVHPAAAAERLVEAEHRALRAPRRRREDGVCRPGADRRGEGRRALGSGVRPAEPRRATRGPRRALARNRRAREFFETLDRANRYAITWRLQTAKRPETRARRLETFVEMLASGRKIHP